MLITLVADSVIHPPTKPKNFGLRLNLALTKSKRVCAAPDISIKGFLLSVAVFFSLVFIE